MKITLQKKKNRIILLQFLFMILSLPNVAHAQVTRLCSFVMMSRQEYKKFEDQLSKDFSDRVKSIVQKIATYRAQSTPNSYESVQNGMLEIKKIAPVVTAYLHDQGSLIAQKMVNDTIIMQRNIPDHGRFSSTDFPLTPIDFKPAMKFHDGFLEVIKLVDHFLDATSHIPKMGFRNAANYIAEFHEQRYTPSNDSIPLENFGIDNKANWGNDQQLANATKENFDPSGKFFVFTFDMSAEGWIIKNSNALLASVSGHEVSEQFWLDLIKNPGDLAKKPLVSLSLLGPGKRATFRTIGVVVFVPPENIIRTRVADFGSFSFSGQQHISEIVRHPEVMDPDELLANTAHYFNNEIQAVGTHPVTGRKIQVIGTILNPSYSIDRVPLSTSEINRWTNWSKRNGFGKPHIIKDGRSIHQSVDNRDLERLIAKKIIGAISSAPTSNPNYWYQQVREKIKKFRTAQGHTIVSLDGLNGEFAFSTFFSTYFKIVETGNFSPGPEGESYFRLELKEIK